MKKLVPYLVAASVSAVSIPSFGANWIHQLEQTTKFQKMAAERRAARERDAQAGQRATREPVNSSRQGSSAVPSKK